MILSLLLAAALGFLVFSSGGVEPVDELIFWLAVSVLGLLALIVMRRHQTSPPLARSFLIPWLCLLAYVCVQLLPMPNSFLSLVSPTRMELAQAVGAVSNASGPIPISISPEATLHHLFRLAGCVLIALLMRELSWRAAEDQWRMLLPIVAVIVLEAGVGVAQYLESRSLAASGTFVNRNHFGGLLALVLPFAVARSLTLTKKLHSQSAALAGCVWIAFGALLLAGILCSLSRMALVSSLLSIAITMLVLLRPARRMYAGLALSVLALALLSPPAMINRFGMMAADESLGPEMRFAVWRDTLEIVSDFPLLGCGLGSFSSALPRYQHSAPGRSVEFAHNDYLQALSELGALGILPVAAVLAAAVRQIVRSARVGRGEPAASLSAACAGSLAAALLQSTVDYNLYIPANVAMVSCILGITAALTTLPRNYAARHHAANLKSGDRAVNTAVSNSAPYVG